MSEKNKSKVITKPKPADKSVREDLGRLISILDQVGFQDFMAYLSSPRRVLWRNLLAGMARGFGIVVGMTVVFAIVIWLLTKLVDFPLIGEYFEKLLLLLESGESFTETVR